MTISTVEIKLTNLASTEIAKSCIFLAAGSENLERGDLVSCGVNTYYGVFHLSVALLALTPKGAFLESAIIDWKDRFQIKDQYVPLSHNRLIALVRDINGELAHSLLELKTIREYICYGPYLCNKSISEWQPIIYTCEVESVRPKLESFYSSFSFEKFTQLMIMNLREDWQKTALSLWIKQTLEIFKESVGITDSTYRRCQNFWSTIRQALFPDLVG